MSYNTITVMATDQDLHLRFIACASQEGVPNPQTWVSQYIWVLAAYDQGAIDAYASAQAADTSNLGDYGKREDVITDGMILSIVQALWASQNIPPAPPPEGTPLSNPPVLTPLQ